jgi:uncharacterized membrane protein
MKESLTFRRLLNYFFRGLLILVPIALTIYIIVIFLQWLDNLIPVQVPGLGLVLVLGIIVLFGYLASTLIARPIFDLLEEILLSVPVISLIYAPIKDLMTAFVGDKKKFTQAVLVTMDEINGVQKLGFITQSNLEVLGLQDKVAVYLPHSYNFSGNFYIVPRERVILLDLPGADVMKFIVSGGVSGYTELKAAVELNKQLIAKKEISNLN